MTVQHKNEPTHAILSFTHDDRNNVQKRVAMAYVNIVCTVHYASMNCLSKKQHLIHLLYMSLYITLHYITQVFTAG